MGENIIDLICNSCSCDKTEAQEYLDSELQYLHELQDVDDLREGDIELACSNLVSTSTIRNILSTASQGHKNSHLWLIFRTYMVWRT